MEESLSKMTQQAPKQKGGFKTMPFIIANEAFERVASHGLLPNMILYLMRGYHIDIATGTSILSLWSAGTNFLPIIGAFISDSYLGPYRTIALGSTASFLEMVLLWLTAMIPQAKPLHSIPSQSCKSATPAQFTLLFASFVLMSIGAGGIRPCSLAFGAAQLIETENPKSKRVVQSFFNWYYVLAATSVLIAMTVIVYIQDHFGWKVGFGVPAIIMFFSGFLFMLASSTYIKAKPNKSLFTGFAQANSMDRHLTSHFQIPAGSFGMFSIGTLIIWVAIYDRLIIPQLAKITGKPYGLGLKQRMGIGLVLSCMAMALSAIVESVRRKTAIKQGFADNPLGVLDMSALWLIPQHCVTGLADSFNIIGQTEFYYSQFPKSMSSIATALFGLGLAFGSLIVGVMVNIVDNITKRGGKESWVSSNLNKGHYDYYYWLLTVMSAVNFLYFLVCCWASGPCEGERGRAQYDGEGMKKEELELKMMNPA
ncbi:hypothetical protein IFM89_019368 [Coptis chinensis]|uniref:NPF family transporter n=1 Tax=Coptis chinensis TaxID=261450 RepID=A0A835I8Y5_9MAGN|nr:hypothetical protein IFM89_019368 [Coptis chinensis]